MKLGEKYFWTKHSQYKMRHYGLSPQRIKRIIRYPARTEEAIVPGLIAVMCPDKKQEIWAMYQLANKRASSKFKVLSSKFSQVKVITAWKYPGKSPARNPIPEKILNEIKSAIF